MEKEYQKIGNVFKFDEKFRTIVGLNEPYETLKELQESIGATKAEIIFNYFVNKDNKSI